MSGRFHKSWGEFGGYKHPDALRLEAAAMIAHGVACSFGDQLHPSGRVDRSAWRMLGQAYRYIEAIEPYGLGGVAASNLGLWVDTFDEHALGTACMLLEGQVDFRVVREDGPWDGIETLILPGTRMLEAPRARRLSSFLGAGGNVVVLGEGALHPRVNRFMVDVGARFGGPPRFGVDYTVPRDALFGGLLKSPFLNYESAFRVRTRPGVEVLAGLREPWFDRTYGHFCSHANTPERLRDAGHPAAWRVGGAVCLAHALGRMYRAHGARVHREFFLWALRLVHTRPMLEVGMPSGGRVSLLHQPRENRYVLHLLYAPPGKRGDCLVIEDHPPVHDVRVRLRTPEPIRRATLVPAGRRLPLRRAADGAVELIVPRVEGHQAVALTSASKM